jgi:trimethylamine--corrinoid protein Co-methyltransferase
MPYEPTQAISDDELDSIHRASLRVLAETGMDFLDPDAASTSSAAGATIEDGGQRVRFDPAMVEEVIRTVPSEFTLHARNPSDTSTRWSMDGLRHGRLAARMSRTWIAVGRIGNREDYQNLLRLGQSLNSVHFLAGYPVEPVDVHHGVRYLHATHDALTLMDKAIHCYSLGRQRTSMCSR